MGMPKPVLTVHCSIHYPGAYLGDRVLFRQGVFVLHSAQAKQIPWEGLQKDGGLGVCPGAPRPLHVYKI